MTPNDIREFYDKEFKPMFDAWMCDQIRKSMDGWMFVIPVNIPKDPEMTREGCSAIAEKAKKYIDKRLIEAIMHETGGVQFRAEEMARFWLCAKEAAKSFREGYKRVHWCALEDNGLNALRDGNDVLVVERATGRVKRFEGVLNGRGSKEDAIKNGLWPFQVELK